ncbi:ribosomal RNA large subunit methyltransferase F [Pseudohyphozyma bogoriensis]|nr:ribosomal RNA large subunit methyltransferase F [Pseudohyphozyma bogoriensis]
MELRNPYTSAPDFSQLALDVPAFAPFVRTTSKGLPTIDFQDEKAVRALTAALLKRDFGLEIVLPNDRLCPMVPGRLEYVLWILQVASVLPTSLTSPRLPTLPDLTGIDIGTGSSAIYPLLACRTLHSVRMVGTEIDDVSFEHARRNIGGNGLDKRVALMRADVEGSVFPEDMFGASSTFDFTMCNPPFYSSAEEVADSLAAKELEPFAVCTGGTREMITPGGEVAFVGRMVDETLVLGDRIRWFSSLLGKYSSVAQIVALLQKHKIDNYAIKDLQQGQTKRWVH